MATSDTPSAFLLRIKGAILYVHGDSGDSLVLIGDFKEPCDLSQFGLLQKDTATNASGTLVQACRKLERQEVPKNMHNPQAACEWHSQAIFLGNMENLQTTTEAMSQQLAAMLLIKRNLSVSERIWSLLQDTGVPLDAARESLMRDTLNKAGFHHVSVSQIIDGQWLCGIPTVIWDIVRGEMLRCV